MAANSCTYEAEVTASNERALRCFLNGDKTNHWIAKSQILPGTEVFQPGDNGKLVVSRWLAQKAHLPEAKIMSFEQKPNSGSLFVNRGREKNPKAPNLKGSALLELESGELIELDIAAWVRESEKAGKWLSLSVKVKQPSSDARSGAGHAAAEQVEDSDIPFIVNFDLSPNRHFPRI